MVVMERSGRAVNIDAGGSRNDPCDLHLVRSYGTGS